MKSIIKFLAPLLFFTGTYSFLNAQIGLGIRGGVNIANTELEEKIDGNWKTDMQDYNLGINASLLAEIGFSERFAFQPEVNFIQKGYKFDLQNGVTHEVTTKLNYVEVPLLLKGKFGNGNLKFNALLGPTFGYAFNGIVKSNDIETDIDFGKDNIKQTEIGAILGLGLGLDAGPGTFFLDGRLGWGITNLDDSDNSDNFHWHNRGLSIGIGYIFQLTK